MSGRKSDREHGGLGLLIGLTTAAIILIGGVFIFLIAFRLTDYEVIGNYHISDEEVIEEVTSRPFGRNTMVLALTSSSLTYGDDTFRTWEDVLTYFERLGGQ